MRTSDDTPRDSYSRTVALLKVVLPLAALALLSTLFLLGRAMQTDTLIPFAEKEVQERLRDQQITGPFFSGMTTGGDQMSFSAEKLVTLQGRVGANRAEEVSASLETAEGSTFQLHAEVAELDIAGDAAELTGQVTLLSSTGYFVTSERIVALDVTADGGVEATGPLGQLTAEQMRVFTPDETNSTQMLFSGGVKLVYTPK